ncbi:NAD(P)/FAD-dependent oxidoreductase [Nocardia spumae]|uniref:NAD(P)/FAD-dependent oxidoreductase n=1 Tax=Nocardia spumae TaxID=2887190 RepID=UPI001D14FB2D|nr:FAD-dependent oxidoreductase [Nocardia spumae]
MTGNIEVVVIGGGYAGVMAANRLTQRDDVAVTLINPRSAFVERIRLHQLAAGTHDTVADYDTMLNDRVRLVVDVVNRIDAAEHRVTLETGATLGYDYLIYAVGSHGADPQVPGSAEFAYPIATLEDARRLRGALDAVGDTAPVVVVGAGPAGIETAAELAERGHRVTLICGAVLGPYLHARARRAVGKRLARLGVTVLAGPEAVAVAVTRDIVRLSGGHTLHSAVTIWTTGFGVPDLAARSGLSTDALGRLRTDETLTSVDDERIIAAGDAAAPSDLPFRMGCQSAVQLGPQAAETVLARIAGGQPAAIEVGFAGQCISLGRRFGIFQFSDRHDTAKPYHLGGRPGAVLKEAICRSTVWQLRYEARQPGVRTWWTEDARRSDLLAARRPAPATSEQI